MHLRKNFALLKFVQKLFKFDTRELFPTPFLENEFNLLTKSEEL